VCESIRQGTVQRITAVGSRSAARARDFAERFEIPAAHGSYQELVADPGVDIVYVATPNSFHHEHARLALEAGKPVVVEKTFTLNQAQAQDLADLAQDRGLFLMEGMWTRFLPHAAELRERLARGVIGDVVTLTVDFGERNAFDAGDRFHDPGLGGGALLDRGVYCVAWAVDLLGLPGTVQARADLTGTGVDGHVSAILGYPERQAQALIQASIVADTPQESWIAGTGGLIRVDRRFWEPTLLDMRGDDGAHDVWTHATRSRGYEYEIAEAARRVSAGETSSPLLPPAQSVAIMGVMDQIRSQIGVRFPGE
jgi:predicted dehydrogenase